MKRLVRHGVLTVGVLAGALATACLGGQTGQPDSGDCSEREASAGAAWRTTTVEAAVAALSGPHRAELSWQMESETSQQPVELADELELGVGYDGANGTEACDGSLTLPVTVSLVTSNSGISESGEGTLKISGSPGALLGDLTYASERVALRARLRQTAAGVTLGGDLDALDRTLPGIAARIGGKP